MKTISEDEIQEEIKKIKTETHANQIHNCLFLGNEISALNPGYINKNKIKYIINCTRDVPMKFVNKVEYFRVPLDDSLKEKDITMMTHYIPILVPIIENNIKNKVNTLVHCHAGMQRSAIVVASYLLKNKNFESHKEAIEFIINKRPIAFFNGQSINFEKSLQKYHDTIKSVENDQPKEVTIRSKPRTKPKARPKSKPRAKPKARPKSKPRAKSATTKNKRARNPRAKK